jgi:acetyl esterase
MGAAVSTASFATSIVDKGSPDVSISALTQHPLYLSPFDNESLDPEVKRHLNVRGPVFALGSRLMPLTLLRRVYNLGGTIDSKLIANKLKPLNEVDVEMPTNGDNEAKPLRGRLYTPLLAHMTGDATPLIFYIHGGGYSIGGLESHSSTCRFLAQTGFRVLAVTYRLAPEARHPAQIKDCFAWYRYVLSKPREYGLSETNPQIIVTGDSAGGQLTISLGLHVRDHNREASSSSSASKAPLTPPVMLAPLYPVINRFREWASTHRYGEGYELSAFLAEQFSKYYLGETAEEREKWRGDQYLHPDLQLDLSGLPPTLLVTAECDILHDEAVAWFHAVRQRGGVGIATPTNISSGQQRQLEGLDFVTAAGTPGFSSKSDTTSKSNASSAGAGAGVGGAAAMPSDRSDDGDDVAEGATQIAHIEAKGLLHGFVTHIGAYKAAEAVMRDVARRMVDVVNSSSTTTHHKNKDIRAIKKALHGMNPLPEVE